jgi:hypothetical protein
MISQNYPPYHVLLCRRELSHGPPCLILAANGLDYEYVVLATSLLSTVICLYHPLDFVNLTAVRGTRKMLTGYRVLISSLIEFSPLWNQYYVKKGANYHFSDVVHPVTASCPLRACKVVAVHSRSVNLSFCLMQVCAVHLHFHRRSSHYTICRFWLLLNRHNLFVACSELSA